MIRLAAIIWRFMPIGLRLKVIRLSQPKFTVSVVAIVLNNENKVLVLDHYIRPGATWGLPGGFIEPGETPETAIKREMFEETQLEVKNPELLRIRTLRKHIEILFFARTEGEVELKTSEIRDYGWFKKSSLPNGMSDLQRNLVKTTLDEKSI